MKKYLNSGYLILFLILVLSINCSKDVPTAPISENYDGDWELSYESPTGSSESLQSATLKFSISGATATLTYILLRTESSVGAYVCGGSGGNLQTSTLKENKLAFDINNYTFYIMFKNFRDAEISLVPF